MPVYLLACSSDVNLIYPLLPLAGVAAVLMGQCCSRSACRDTEVNLTREGPKPTCAISFGPCQDFPDFTSFTCKALNLCLFLTAWIWRWIRNVQSLQGSVTRKDWPCQWSCLCFWWETKIPPLSLMFLKNARNVDERSLIFYHPQVTVAHSWKARLPVSCEEHWLMHLRLKMASISA